MTVEVGGAGTLGVAFETTLGTYVAPAKYIPIRSESLTLAEGKVYRMNLRGKADPTGAIKGYFHVEGDITFEVTSDIMPYFLLASRAQVIRTSTSSPFTYVATPTHQAKSATAAPAATSSPTTCTVKTLSALVARSANPMAYTGLSVAQQSYTVDGGVLVATFSMIGSGESAQSAGTPTYIASDPFGPGEVTLEIPSATARADADTFTLNVNDNGVAANRLNGQRTAAYINWGEREVSASVEVDFDALTDFNDFTSQTIRTVKVIATNSTADSYTILLNAGVPNAWSSNLAGLGDVNRASLSYRSIFDTTDAYTITCVSATSVT